MLSILCNIYALQFLDHFSRIPLLNKRIFLVWKYFSPTAIFFPILFALMKKLFSIFGLKKDYSVTAITLS